MCVEFEVYMFKTVLKVLVLAVMLVAFVGQAMAFNTSMPCETSVDSHDNIDLANHYDSNHLETDKTEDCCGIACCDVGCTCIGNACSSFIYFHTEVNSAKTAALSDVLYIQQAEQPKSISTLLYRPPIFTL